jgi:hypothetical protein
MTASVAPPRWGRFSVQSQWEPSAINQLILLQEAAMAHWRKRNPPASRFNAYLAGWAFTLSVVLGTLVVLSLHGRV